MQTRREMARGFLSRTSVGLNSKEDAIERMGALLAVQHSWHGAVFFERDADGETIDVIVRDERFTERVSPDFPSEELVAKVVLATRFNGNED